MKKEFKYKTVFASQVRCIINSERDKFLARASLENLKGLIPDEVKNQDDLLCISLNAFTPNLANKNMDLVDTKTALEIYKLFIHKAINNEHSRGSGAIGHIVSAGFSKFNINYANGVGSELLEITAVEKTKEPFNVSLAGVLYKLYANKLIDYIEESNDPNSDHWMDVSGSWELLFDQFHLAVGSKYLNECEIIDDPKKIEEMSKFLTANGGTGKIPDGKPIYRLIVGTVVPAGIGLTQSPAGELKGLVTDSEKSKITIKSSEEKDKSSKSNILPSNLIEKLKNLPESGMGYHICDLEMDDGSVLNNINVSNCSELPENIDGGKIKNIKLSISHNKINNVNGLDNKNNKNSNKVMIKDLKDITDENLKEAKANEITTVLDSEIKKINDDWKIKKEAVDTELKASNEKLTDLQKKYEDGQSSLTKVQEDLNKIIEANKKKELEELFSNRMSYFDSEYILDEKERNVVGNSIKDKNEEDYKVVKENLETLLAAKKKGKKVFDKKTMKWVDPEEIKEESKETKETKASTETKTEEKVEENKDKIVEDAINNGEKTKTTIAATTTVTETLTDKAKRLFGMENWEVDKRNLRK